MADSFIANFDRDFYLDLRIFKYSSYRLMNVNVMITRLKVNVFLLSYRGFGASRGHPTQDGIIMDSVAALDHLRSREDIDRYVSCFKEGIFLSGEYELNLEFAILHLETLSPLRLCETT